ncbi:MAG TPA: DUF1634 domain-containing protein [Thermoanaerobaculia bacterium]|nr:DUF1634 domain-containing protein [Thermoanaerobaculia bacterium]
MKPWIDVAIATLLRTGVVLSIAIIAGGMIVTFAHHPEYFSSRPALGQLTSPGAHFPNTLTEVVAGVARGRGQAIMMAGLLVLIATPVARVAMSVVIFIIERDRLFIVITAAVFAILMISFAVGRGGA